MSAAPHDLGHGRLGVGRWRPSEEHHVLRLDIQACGGYFADADQERRRGRPRTDMPPHSGLRTNPYHYQE